MGFENESALWNTNSARVLIEMPGMKLEIVVDESPENAGAVYDYEINVPGVAELDLELYANASDIILKSDDIFGGEAYGLHVTNLKEDLKNAKLWEFAGITYDEFIAHMENEIGFDFLAWIGNLGGYLANAATLEAEYTERFIGILDGAERSVKFETVDVADGEINALVLDYVITADLLKDLANAYIDMFGEMPIPESPEVDFVGTYREGFDMMIESFEESVDDMRIIATVNTATGKISKIAFAFDVEDEEGKIELDLGKIASESTKYVLTAYGGSESVGTIEYIKEDTEDKLVHRIVMNSEGEKLVEGVFTYDRATGAFDFAMDGMKIFGGSAVFSDDSVSGTVEIGGELFDFNTTSTDTSYTFEVGCYGETILAFVWEIASLPEFPEYLNIFEMDKEDFEAMAEAVYEFNTRNSTYDEDYVSFEDFEVQDSWEEYSDLELSVDDWENITFD